MNISRCFQGMLGPQLVCLQLIPEGCAEIIIFCGDGGITGVNWRILGN